MSGRAQAFLLALLVTVLVCGCGRPAPGDEVQVVGRPPDIWPDYRDVTIPPNIAPLRFRVREEGDAYLVRITAADGQALDVPSREPTIAIPVERWRRLLAGSKGGTISYSVYVRSPGGGWRRFADFTNAVAAEPIDAYIVYRTIPWLYIRYSRLAIHERRLTDFTRRTVLESESFSGCLNCHAFPAQAPGTMSIEMRSSSYGTGIILVRSGTARKVDTRTPRCIGPAAYPSWEPRGHAIAFSMNKVMQFFHTARREPRDVADSASDIALYLVGSGQVVSAPALASPDYLETYPAWSADGKYLYFCRAPLNWSDAKVVPPPGYDDLKYDLMRIPCDLDTGEWGDLETVLASDTTGLSITLPRVSPDGRFIMFCMSEYSCFPAFQDDADLYVLDLESGEYRRCEASSDRAESWHSWSANSRWAAFSSKRDDGMVTRAYICYVDRGGRTAKPFLLPESDPGVYDGCLETCNVPELTPYAVPASTGELIRAARSAGEAVAEGAVTSASPAAAGWPGVGGTPWASDVRR